MFCWFSRDFSVRTTVGGDFQSSGAYWAEIQSVGSVGRKLCISGICRQHIFDCWWRSGWISSKRRAAEQMFRSFRILGLGFGSCGGVGAILLRCWTHIDCNSLKLSGLAENKRAGFTWDGFPDCRLQSSQNFSVNDTAMVSHSHKVLSNSLKSCKVRSNSSKSCKVRSNSLKSCKVRSNSSKLCKLRANSLKSYDLGSNAIGIW